MNLGPLRTMSTGVAWTVRNIVSTGGIEVIHLEDLRATTAEHKPSAQRPPKYACSYCKGKTYDDIYGHCSACGAPRDE